MDVIQNGNAYGSVASQLLMHGCDPNALRPYIGRDGRTYITVNKGGKMVQQPIFNANATLRKDEWIELDKAVIKAAQPRLKLVADLRSRGLTHTIPNGMGKTILESQSMGDISDAELSMDGLRQSREDRPIFDIAGLPLPIVHKDFSFSARQIAVSRNGSTPLDTSMAELAARKVAEKIEKMAIGVHDDYTYGGATIQGLITSSERIPQVLTSPTLTAWDGATLVGEILAMKQKAMDQFHYGPFVLYTSTAWEAYLDEDYSADKGDNTVRERLAKIAGIDAIVTLDFLTGFDMVLVEMTADTIRLVIGMDITTLQWETHGGMLQHFKVMAIMVPQIRGDFYGNAGIVHGAVAA